MNISQFGHAGHDYALYLAIYIDLQGQNRPANMKVHFPNIMKFRTFITASSTFKTGCSRQKDSESTCNRPYTYEIWAPSDKNWGSTGPKVRFFWLKQSVSFMKTGKPANFKYCPSDLWVAGFRVWLVWRIPSWLDISPFAWPGGGGPRVCLLVCWLSVSPFLANCHF